MRDFLLTVIVAAGCASDPHGESISKLDACADQQRLWCDLAGVDDVECWNVYFDWCMPEPRLQTDDVSISIDVHDRCMADLLATTPAPLGHWLPDQGTVPASCQQVWGY